MARQKFTGITGLPLPRQAIRILRERGIYAHAPVSIEHQILAGHYVLRGLESGGSAENVGRYVTFSSGDGQKLECLHPVEAIAVNGLHAVVIASEFVRADMLRKDRTYELLITGHRLGPSDNGSRPQLQTEILFRGIHGRLELDLSRRDKAQAGRVVPSFYSLGRRAGRSTGEIRGGGTCSHSRCELHRMLPFALSAQIRHPSFEAGFEHRFRAGDRN